MGNTGQVKRDWTLDAALRYLAVQSKRPAPFWILLGKGGRSGVGSAFEVSLKIELARLLDRRLGLTEGSLDKVHVERMYVRPDCTRSRRARRKRENSCHSRRERPASCVSIRIPVVICVPTWS